MHPTGAWFVLRRMTRSLVSTVISILFFRFIPPPIFAFCVRRCVLHSAASNDKPTTMSCGNAAQLAAEDTQGVPQQAAVWQVSYGVGFDKMELPSFYPTIDGARAAHLPHLF